MRKQQQFSNPVRSHCLVSLEIRISFPLNFVFGVSIVQGSKGKYAGEYAQLEGSENSNVEQKVDLDNSNGKTTRRNPSKSKSRCINETSDSSIIEKCNLRKN